MNNGIKSFWDRPEGQFGKAFTILMGGGLLYGAYHLLPYLVDIVENTLYLISLLAVLGIVIFLITSGKIQALGWYFFQVIMRKITGVFITIDPIGILKSHIDDLKTKLVKMEESIERVSGERGKLNNEISKREKERIYKLKLAEEAEKNPKLTAEKISYARQAAKLSELLTNLTGLSSKMELIINTLSDMKYYAKVMIQDNEFEVDIREREYKIIKESHKAMKSAMSVLHGDKDQKAIFEETMAFVNDDIGNKIGEMDRMLSVSYEFINSVNLQDGVANTEGLKLLEEFKQKGLENIFGKTGTNNETVEVKVLNAPQNGGSLNSKYFD